MASHVEFRDLAADDWYARTPADDVILRNLDVDLFIIGSASNVQILGGDVGPHENSDPIVGQWAGPPPTGIVIDGVHFHDIVKVAPEAHTECLQFTAGVDVTIRNSRFERCTHTMIFIKADQGPLRNFLIENNWFDRTIDGYYSLRLAAKEGRVCQDFLVRNNSALQAMYSDCEAKNVRFVANLQPEKSAYSCSTSFGAVWDWNIYGSGEPCGPHDLVASLGFRDPAAFDLHLRRDAAAVDRSPAVAPRTDIDGQARPLGSRPDAGADERR